MKLYSDTELDSDIKYVKEIFSQCSNSCRDIGENFSRINKTIIKNIWVLLLESISVIVLPDILNYLRDHYTSTKIVTIDGNSFPEYKWYLTDYALYFEAYIIVFFVFIGIKLVRMWAIPSNKSN